MTWIGHLAEEGIESRGDSNKARAIVWIIFFEIRAVSVPTSWNFSRYNAMRRRWYLVPFEKI